MRLTRTFVVLLVTVALLAVAMPAAQARPLEGTQPSVHSQGGTWLASALDRTMNWLARFAGSEPPTVMTAKTTTTTTGSGTTTGGHYIPMTGGCVDPLGTPRCGGN